VKAMQSKEPKKKSLSPHESIQETVRNTNQIPERSKKNVDLEIHEDLPTEATADARYTQKLNALNETTVGKYIVSDLPEVVSGRYLKPPDDVKNDSAVRSISRELTNATMSMGANVLIAGEEGMKGIGRLGKAVGKEMLHPWELMVKAGKVTMNPIDSTKKAGKAIANFGNTLAEDTKSAWRNSPPAGRGGAALAMAVRTVTGAHALKASKLGQISRSVTDKKVPKIADMPSKPKSVSTVSSKPQSALNKAATATINTANLSRLTNSGDENLPTESNKLFPMTMKEGQTKNFPDEMWTTTLNSWKEYRKLSEEQVVLLRAEPVSTFAIKSENGSDVSFYFPEKYQEQMEALKGSISAVETELQEYVRSHFPEYTDAVKNPNKNPAKIIFAEGLGKEAHKTRQDLVMMDTQELSNDKRGELMEKYIHERTHQILHYYLSDSVGSTQHMGLMEGIANVMPEIMYILNRL